MPYSDYDLNKCLFYSSTTDKQHSTKLNKPQRISARQDAHDFIKLFISLDALAIKLII